MRQARVGLFSALPPQDEGARYDAHAAAHDRLVGSTLYNRLAWSASTESYRGFARRALASTEGPVLEAGSGTAVFTAEAYVEAARSGRAIVLVDRSLDMLEAARDRIARLNGGAAPRSVQFVQADLLDLPFESGTFGCVLSMGTLHLFASAERVARSLAGVVEPGGGIYLTSLVAETALGRRYLALLARMGEVAPPRSFAEARAQVEGILGAVDSDRDGSMAYFVGRAK